MEGRDLPADRAAAACDRIDTLARAIKRAGAGKRRIDHIRVDLFIGSTDGTFEGMTDEEIITHVVNHPLITNPNDGDTTSTGTGTSTNTGTGDRDGNGSADRADNADATDEAEWGHGDDEADDDGDGPDEGGLDDGSGPPAGGADGSGSPGDDTGDSDDEGTGAPDTTDSCDSAGAIGATSGTDAASTDAGTVGSAGVTARPAGCGWAVREVRVELATLLGWNDHPGEIPGTGYVPAALARQLAASMGSGQWRYVICGPLGRLISCGILATRPCPDGATPRRNERRGGIVEIGVTTGELDHLVTTTGTHDRWAGVTAELAHRYAQYLADADPEFDHIRPDEGTSTPNGGQGTSAPGGRHGTNTPNARGGASAPSSGHDASTLNASHGTSVPGSGLGLSVPGGGPEATSGDGVAGGAGTADTRRRLPGAKLRREIQLRDRQCVHPACRMPATRTDQDHAHDYLHGGLTTAANLSAVCRHDHRLKHDGGWTVSKPEAAIARWDTPLGHTYVSVPPPVIPRLPYPQPRNHDGYDLLPDTTIRGCGCYGHCTCGPTMPTDETDTETETERQPTAAPAPDSDEAPLRFDDEPPY